MAKKEEKGVGKGKNFHFLSRPEKRKFYFFHLVVENDSTLLASGDTSRIIYKNLKEHVPRVVRHVKRKTN